MRYIYSLILTALLSACVTSRYEYQQTIKTWQGSSLQALSEHWGRPDEKITTLNGRTVYLYKTRIGIKVLPHSSRNRGKSLTCITVFEANKKGIIVSAKSYGSSCTNSPQVQQKKKAPHRKISGKI